jgi:membrane protein DedA with SNARE-associated domain
MLRGRASPLPTQTVGMSKVKFRAFACYAYPGGLVWVICFVSIGYYVGAEWDRFRSSFNRGALVAIGVVAAIALAGWLLRRKSPIA